MWSTLENVDTEIGHVTNGVHLGTWLDPALASLLEETGVTPSAPPDDANWPAARNLDRGRVWETHAAAKRRLSELTHLDPERLTIGFARRFATYKRAALVYTDLERLLAMPIQLVVAGKAHPQDNPGKDVMQAIIRLAREHSDRIVFLEDYDIGLAQTIIPGVDVWLNNPTRPLEASGTSGMKAAVNGVPNLSVLDGWWPEGYSPEVGWAIEGVSDEADLEQLYTLLENDVVPQYAERERWVETMVNSIATLAPQFSMHRAVIEYVERYYLPAASAG
jgi:starch phosphorylase